MLTAWALLLFLAMWVRSTFGGPLSFRIGKLQKLMASTLYSASFSFYLKYQWMSAFKFLIVEWELTFCCFRTVRSDSWIPLSLQSPQSWCNWLEEFNHKCWKVAMFPHMAVTHGLRYQQATKLMCKCDTVLIVCKILQNYSLWSIVVLQSATQQLMHHRLSWQHYSLRVSGWYKLNNIYCLLFVVVYCVCCVQWYSIALSNYPLKQAGTQNKPIILTLHILEAIGRDFPTLPPA